MLAVVDRLAAAGAEVAFTALTVERGPLTEALQERGIPRIPVPMRDGKGNRLPRDRVRRNLVNAVRAAGPDLVHANSLSMGRLTGAAADELTVPTAVHLRDILKLSRAAVADLNRNAQLIAVSEATRRFHVSQGVDADRTRVLYNGVDVERFRPRPATGALLRELGLPGDAFLVGCIGQIGLRKGQDVLAAAAARAGDRLPRAQYLLIGARHSGKRESIEFERSVVSRFRAAGLGDRLHCLGYRADVDRLLNEIDVLVHPAHQEPLGRVLLEAGAAGVPIIATAVGGTEEILAEGESARLVPANEPAALADRLAELYADPEERSRLGTAARARVVSGFDIRDAAWRLAEVWRTV